VPSNFSIDESSYRGLVYLILHGEIDLGCVATIRSAVARILETSDVTGLIIDLDDVTFIDSTGIGCLVGSRNEADRLAIPFAVINPRHRVRNTLDMVGVSTHLNLDHPPTQPPAPLVYPAASGHRPRTAVTGAEDPGVDALPPTAAAE
jgi:anti-sigma B factor antagonist